MIGAGSTGERPTRPATSGVDAPAGPRANRDRPGQAGGGKPPFQADMQALYLFHGHLAESRTR
jgi:hypothetical protein